MIKDRGPHAGWLRLCILLLTGFCGAVFPAHAHIGSKDVFEQISAGPYKLFVTIRAPSVVPGVAAIELRTLGPQVQGIKVAPVPLVGEASKHPPTADALKASGIDPNYFSGSVWLMSPGSWQIRFRVAGAGGIAEVSVPVPAVALSTLHMQRSLGLMLGGLGLLLAFGMTGIIFAAVREARVPPGEIAPAYRMRRAVVAGGVALLTMGMLAWFGNRWWNVEAADYGSAVFRPLTMHAVLKGEVLDLRIDQGRSDAKGYARSNADLLLDHGKVMHLYALRWPEMDAAYHLHPAQVAAGDLRLVLPSMVPGTYHLFGDIVHRNGLPETLTATLEIAPGVSRAPLAPEDAQATPAPLSHGDLGTRYRLPDGYTMVWDRPATLTASTAELFRFKLLDSKGELAGDVVPYLGMAGHAAFVKTDGSVFAHTHPDGSAAMPAMMLANGDGSSMGDMAMGASNVVSDRDVREDARGGHAAGTEPLDPIVEFPYGFPTGGRYRIFVQMKHGDIVETGVFDAEVVPSA